jgi:hypothetical protein
MLKNGFSPRLMTLESREQPGSVFSTGLDASILAGAFLGDALVDASRPIARAAQVATKTTDATDVAVLPAERLNTHSASTIKQAEAKSLDDVAGLGVPNVAKTARLSNFLRPGSEGQGGDSGTRGPNLLFYGGDLDGRNGLANEFNTAVADARTFDDFRFRAPQVVDCMFSRNLMSFYTSSANVTILGPGVATAGIPNGGLPVVYSGTALPATHTFTGNTAFGFFEVEVKVCGIGAAVAPGHYYYNVQPIGTGDPFSRSFHSTTSGANFKGAPIANHETYFDSPTFGAVFQDTTAQLGPGTWDFSGGLCNAPAC